MGAGHGYRYRLSGAALPVNSIRPAGFFHLQSSLVSIASWVLLASVAIVTPPQVGAQLQEGTQLTGGDSMEVRCQEEVHELHQFFQDWFNAVLPPTEDAFQRFESVMAERFLIISPEGVLTEREELVDRLRDAHGIWRQNSQPGRIWIENLQVRHVVGAQAMVLYEEWQEIEGEVRGRLSTAILQGLEGTPNGVEWLHVHEVWMPD